MRLPFNGPIVDTSAGRVMGKLVDHGELTRFDGIPYAAPPVGDRRWRPPQPPVTWSGVRRSRSTGPVALQRATGLEVFFGALVGGLGLSAPRQALLMQLLKLPRKQSEDCLTINVVAPTGARDLPVMVWIHGGDHCDGAGSEPLYRSPALAERGCVLMTFNYRLGLMGFFAHPELLAESPDGTAGNYGLLDQIAALRWVRDNIANFGGDPDRVTIFGESAGGQAVLNLMAAPQAHGLFHRAIPQSPSDGGRWLHLDRDVLRFRSVLGAGSAFADRVVGDRPGQLARLRAMDGEELYEHYRQREDLGRHFYPCADGNVLPEPPLLAFSHGRQAPVPLLVGYNADEASLFGDIVHPAGPEMGLSSRFGGQIDVGRVKDALIESHGGPEAAERLTAAYPGLADLDPRAVEAHLGDHLFGSHVEHVSSCHASQGHPTWRYHFRALPPSPGQTIGAYHAAEISYVFGRDLPLFPTADNAHLLRRTMGDHWFAFAATGDPNHPGQSAWPRFDPDHRRQMIFDRPFSAAGDCPREPGLELMVERIARLGAVLAGGAGEALRPPGGDVTMDPP